MAEEDTNRAHKEKQILFECRMISEHGSCLIVTSDKVYVKTFGGFDLYYQVEADMLFQQQRQRTSHNTCGLEPEGSNIISPG